METNKNISTGVMFGILIGLIYCILLFWRWTSASNVIYFGLSAFGGYIIIISLMFYEAFYRRKQDGGSIALKTLYQTLFISVLIFELIYSVYNFLHLKYIDPNVVDRMKVGVEQMLDKAGSGMSDEDKDKALSRFDEMKQATQLAQIVKGYFVSISISGVVALLVSIIMRKRKPVFE
jgi:hypothetical protein